jgi:septal ring factor EnvC (AmiA/AmiB activator)
MTPDSALGTSLFGMTGLSAKTPRAQSRRGLWAVVVVLSLALVGLGAGLANSVHSARVWQDTALRRTTELSAAQRQRDDLKAQLASMQSQLEATRQQLTDLTDQSNGAASQPPSLAGRPVQAGDQAAYLAEMVALSDRMTQDLDICVTEVQSLSSYLLQYQGRDMTNLLDFSRRVGTDCKVAKSDNATLAQRLATQ